jgi:hypothetical protein
MLRTTPGTTASPECVTHTSAAFREWFFIRRAET